ncbi:MAG: low molecular weight phosphotyrosine protein phosphatase [Christensenellaceae bacterium]|nr:low molecular weight phosphotyrosine protein phosphatase [Christensenellaceae bacterium]
MNIIFVCYGNICRSTMAEFMMKHYVKKRGLEELYHIESAGTSRENLGDDTYYRAQQTLREHNIPYQKRRARQINQQDYEFFDYILCMDDNNLYTLKYMFNGDSFKKCHKIMSFSGSADDVADPWYTRNFEKTFEDLELGINAFLDKMEESGAHKN